MPSIEQDLGLATSELQWIVSGYVLGYGGFLLLGGRAADLLGRRRVLIGALAVFTVASALGAVVEDGTLLVVQGRTTDEVGELAFAIGAPVHELAVEAASLEEVFFHLTSDQEASAPA